MKEIKELENLWVEHKRLMAMLPILEHPYPEVLDKIEASSCLNNELLSDVVEYSLEFPSRHWALAAVSWVESGFPINSSICEKLLVMSNNKSDSQQLRHKYFTQARRWQRTNNTLE